jgi:hypothetical protein
VSAPSVHAGDRSGGLAVTKRCHSGGMAVTLAVALAVECSGIGKGDDNGF